MAESLVWALNRARAQTLSLVADVSSDSMILQAVPGERHPAWILGHLLLADAYLIHLLTCRPLADDFAALVNRYGPASMPGATAPGDSKDRLVEGLRQADGERVALVSAMNDRDLAAPMRDAFLAQVQPTIGHHLESLVFHEGYHAGQLSAWRRAHGFATVRWAMGPL
jgi:hypothetical protein